MDRLQKYTIAIDGPAASGKSSTAEEVARVLCFERIDSGLLYRAVTHLVYGKWRQMAPAGLESPDVVQFVNSLSIRLDRGRIYNENEDITEFLRSPFIDSKVGEIAKKLYIREKIHKIQRDIIEASGTGVVVDGRDIGTVVMPDAFLKVFITSKDTTRAMRRSAQTGQKYEDVLQDLRQRDHADITRQYGPLKLADDAYLIENDCLTLDETVKLIISRFNKKLN